MIVIKKAVRAGLLAICMLGAVGAHLSFAETTPADPGGDLDAEKMALAHKYLEASKSGEMLAKMTPMIMQQMIAALGPHMERELGGEAEGARFRKFMDAFSKELQRSLLTHEQDFLNAMAAAHARVNTREELEAVTAFMNSPTGQKFVAATPKLIEEIMPKIVAVQEGKDIEILEPPSAEKKEAAEKMLKASQTDQLTEQLLAQAVAAADEVPPEQKTATDRGMENYTKEMAKNITENKDKLNQLFISIWSRHFSVEEMKTVTVYYESEPGRSFMASMPKIIEEQQKQMMPLMGKIMGEMMPTVMKLIEEQKN